MDEYFDAHINAFAGTKTMEQGVSSGGGLFDGWGAVAQDILGFYAKSRIDAEYNAPTRLAERQMMLQAEDGSLFGAGTVDTGLSRFIVPGIFVAVGLVVLVVVLKD